MIKPIFTVTTVQESLRSRCVGWFPTKKDAIEVVVENHGNINECGYYPYAVVEVVKPGLYNFDRKEIWFVWNFDKQQYIKCSKPDKFVRSVCYSMG